MVNRPGPLAGLKVIDVATIIAAPLVATMLGDFGADVIKIEHPKGDSLRNLNRVKDGVPLWWKLISRNKRCITLDLGEPAGAEVFKKLVAEADVLIENFRPGTLEKWGLGWDVLHELNPRLIMARVTMFGQEGPYSSRPGFGTLAEAMTGFANITGFPDGPPTLPPFALADGITAMAGAWAVAFALYNRDARGGGGQFIDLAIYEPLLTILGPQPIVYDQLGIIHERSGNRPPGVALRNVYQTADGRFVAISASSDSMAERIAPLVGHPELLDQPWYRTGRSRGEHADELDAIVGGWIAERDLETVMREFEKAEAAIAPIYDISHVMADPHMGPRSITSIPDSDFGQIKMQNVLAKFSETPGSIRWAGPAKGAHNQQIFQEELGLTVEEVAELERQGVI